MAGTIVEFENNIEPIEEYFSQVRDGYQVPSALTKNYVINPDSATYVPKNLYPKCIDWYAVQTEHFGSYNQEFRKIYELYVKKLPHTIIDYGCYYHN